MSHLVSREAGWSQSRSLGSTGEPFLSSGSRGPGTQSPAALRAVSLGPPLPPQVPPHPARPPRQTDFPVHLGERAEARLPLRWVTCILGHLPVAGPPHPGRFPTSYLKDHYFSLEVQWGPQFNSVFIHLLLTRHLRCCQQHL